MSIVETNWAIGIARNTGAGWHNKGKLHHNHSFAGVMSVKLDGSAHGKVYLMMV